MSRLTGQRHVSNLTCMSERLIKTRFQTEILTKYTNNSAHLSNLRMTIFNFIRFMGIT